ncbi:MAG: hypothetical protein AAF725_12835, partial [Acidobacteriota bacterium]
MGFIKWLVSPALETYRLAPVDEIRGKDPEAIEGASALEADTFEKLERQRASALLHRQRSLQVGVPAVLLAVAATYFICTAMGYPTADAAFRGLIAAVIGGLILWVLSNIGVWIFRKTAKYRVLAVLAAEQGLTYRISGVDRDTIQLFEDQNLFGSSSNSGDTEDAFSGEIDGVDFLLFEALREDRRRSSSSSGGSSSKTVEFHGLCLRLGFPKRFS